MNSVHHTWRQQIPTNKNEKENGYMQEPNRKLLAWSSSFGQSDNFSLYSHLMGGRAQFRVQTSGQWIISIYHKQEVTKEGDLRKFYGKTDEVYHGATLTFNVK